MILILIFFWILFILSFHLYGLWLTFCLFSFLFFAFWCFFRFLFLVCCYIECLSWITVIADLINYLSICNWHSFQWWTISIIFGIILTCKISYTFSTLTNFFRALRSRWRHFLRLYWLRVDWNLYRSSVLQIFNLWLFCFIYILYVFLKLL